MPLRTFIPEHDNRDIGWRIPFGENQQHYYRGNEQSNVALSHCGQVEMKAMLGKSEFMPRCNVCSIIEESRRPIVGEIKNGGSIDKK